MHKKRKHKNQSRSKIARFLGKIFNVSPHEVPRIAGCWGLRFFFQIGYTIGWTMLTAILVSRIGIGYLPFLYLANAALVILGTAFFSEIVGRVSKTKLIAGTVVAGVAMLTLAGFALASGASTEMFLGLALVAEAIFFAQVNILLGLFIEETFSPLESSRAFPLVETSEYIGGIAGGLAILGALRFFHVETPQLAWIWVGSVAMILPILLIFVRKRKKLPSLKFAREKSERISRLHKIREGGKHVRRTPFLRGLFFVILLQWAMFTMLDFQYTKAVDENVSHAAAEEIHAEDHHSEEAMLTHSLSTLHVTFLAIAFFTQLFLTSRILGRFGVVRTLRIHPAATFLTTLAMTFRYGFVSAVVAKAAFETTSGIYNAAYHSSFYALRESVREHAKEFLEGLVRPLGVAFGTGALLLFESVFVGENLTLAVNLTLVGGALTMATILWRSRERYTHVAKKNLELFGTHPDKFHSVEVLTQKGHVNSPEILIKSLIYKKEPDELRIKMLEALGRLRDPATIPEILKCFDDPNPAVKLAAVNTLAEFKDLGSHFFSQAFTRYRVISSLKELFERENSKAIRSAIVRVFANMHQAEIVPFLVETIDKSSDEVRADCVYVCGLFHDVAAAHFIEPHLKSENPYVRANAIISLWQFPHYRLPLTIRLTSLLESDDRETEIAAIHTLGEIGAIQELPRLLRYLEHEDAELRLLASLALGKLNHAASHETVAEFLLHENEEFAATARKHFPRISLESRKKIERIVHQNLSRRLHEILSSADAATISELPEEILLEIRKLYSAAGDLAEVAKIDAALAGKNFD